jgi:hypothetical protein
MSHLMVAAASLRKHIFGVRNSSFIHILQSKLEGGGERGEGCNPSDLLCRLTVIWSGGGGS